MTEYVQRLPKIEAERYRSGSHADALTIQEVFANPEYGALAEFRSLGWTAEQIAVKCAYKWKWVQSAGHSFDRPTRLADGSFFETGYISTQPGLWHGLEEQGCGAGVTQWREVPDGYVYAGWALAPSWLSAEEFEKHWESVPE